MDLYFADWLRREVREVKERYLAESEGVATMEEGG